jgi:hypothetical protein
MDKPEGLDNVVYWHPYKVLQLLKEVSQELQVFDGLLVEIELRIRQSLKEVLEERAVHPLDDEWIRSEIALRRNLKRSLAVQKYLIKRIHSIGGTAKGIDYLGLVLGKVAVDKWISDPRAASEEMGRLLTEAFKEKNAIRSLEAMIEKGK